MNAARKTEPSRSGMTTDLVRLAKEEGIITGYAPLAGRLRVIRSGPVILLSDKLTGASHDYWLARAIQHIQAGDGDGICLDSEVLQL